MFSLKKTTPKKSLAQMEAEKKAVEMLTHAQKLMVRGDEHLDEARRMRLEVTQQILPPRRMYIVGKHPKSLLKDVDKRISRAMIRKTLHGLEGHTKLKTKPNPVVERFNERAIKRTLRYERTKQLAQEQWTHALAIYTILALFAGILMFYLWGVSAGDSFGSFFKQF